MIPEPIEEQMPEFWEGNQNMLVRYWTYLHRGLDLINQAKYWIAGVIAMYVMFKLSNPLWMAVMFILSTPVLIIVGRWHLYKASKPQEFIIAQKGTVLGYKPYNMQIRQLELLEEILKELKNEDIKS